MVHPSCELTKTCSCEKKYTNCYRLFMHGGFTNRICDFDWNKNDPWLMMGAAEDNQLQIFRPSRKLVEPLKKTVNHGEVSD
jgi:histone-binding protein RBBP4